MSEKVKKVLLEKLPIAVVAAALTFLLFSAIASPGFIELMKWGRIAGAS